MRIYYTKKNSFRDFLMGVEFLEEAGKLPKTKDDLEKTHILVAEIEEMGFEDAWYLFNCEKNPLIKKQDKFKEWDLGHTSMSIGDIIEDKDGNFRMVNCWGFTKIF